MSLTGSFACRPLLHLDGVSTFDPKDGAGVQWQVPFETVNSLFNAYFTSQVPNGSSVLQVGSSIYVGLPKAVFSSYLSILMDVSMYMGPGHALGALSRTGEDERES